MGDYVRVSLETHLFFARIMKEHALFLKAGFAAVDTAWIERAEFFRLEFEKLLKMSVEAGDRRVSLCVLKSGELTTEFTLPAERMTAYLSEIPIDSDITAAEKELRPMGGEEDRRAVRALVDQMNDRACDLLDDLIAFKESILKEVDRGRLFTFNYPLLIRHIQREAKLYRAAVGELKANRDQFSLKKLLGQEDFWNRIMMEHALFIRGLLDPCEEELIRTADKFAMDYQALLDEAERRDCRAAEGLSERSLQKTREYRKFKAAGTEGILDSRIDSVILPLLADHVLREANHYIRILENGSETCGEQTGE